MGRRKANKFGLDFVSSRERIRFDDETIPWTDIFGEPRRILIVFFFSSPLPLRSKRARELSMKGGSSSISYARVHIAL